MIFTIPLGAGTVLANVVYQWITNGAAGTITASGITQPNTNFPVFRIDTGGAAPSGAEELLAWDSTNLSNWNAGGYRINQIAGVISSAQNLYLSTPWVPTTGPSVIVPSAPAAHSICRCYGTWNDISSLSVDGVPMVLTLVAVDLTDPTLIYDLSSTPLKNTETGLIVADRVVNLLLVAGQLQNANGDPFVDMNRTDYISGLPANTGAQYMLTCDVLGAPVGMVVLTSASPVVFQPVLFKLDTSTIGVSVGGTFDLSKKAVA